MIKQLYPTYFQKSRSFLYPMTGLRREAGFRPKNTYLRLNVNGELLLSEKDRKLLVLYEAAAGETDPSGWKDHQRQLLRHELLEHLLTLPDGRMLAIFDLFTRRTDLERFLAGKYSTFSERHRREISEYYGVHTPEWAYLDSYLYPEKHYGQYAKLLFDRELDQHHGEAILRENVELCSRYDPALETFFVELAPNVVEQLGIV
jgi:hypothetical protein